MGRSVHIDIPIGQYRTNSSDSFWDLPPWGHPLGQGVMPLFISVQDSLIPVGTAFTIGRGVPFLVTAAHNIREALKYERGLNHLLIADTLPPLSI